MSRQAARSRALADALSDYVRTYRDTLTRADIVGLAAAVGVLVDHERVTAAPGVAVPCTQPETQPETRSAS